MKHWSLRGLLGMAGYHLASEPHLRMQVLIVRDETRPLWKIARGELVVLALSGESILKTEDDEVTLEAFSQALLTEGESFALYRSPGSEAEAVVQLTWAPGMSGER